MTLQQQLSELEELVYGYALFTNSSDLNVSGSVETGHVINADNSFSDGGTNPNNNNLPGACCFATCECRQLSPTDCVSQHGVPVGGGTICTSHVCDPFGCGGGGTTGACCYVGGGCNVTTAAFCGFSRGYYAGDGTACDSTDCHSVIPGGCCCPEGCTGGGHSGDCTDPSCTFVEGGNCSDCPPPEPTGACCQTPTSMCIVTTEAACTGLFHEGIDCTGVDCEHDFCGPTSYYCDPGNPLGCHEHMPPYWNPHPVCCPNDLPQCSQCYDPFSQRCYACCCTEDFSFCGN